MYFVVCFVFAKLTELNSGVWETLSFIYEPNDGDKSSVGWVIIGEDGIGLRNSLVPGWAVSRELDFSDVTLVGEGDGTGLCQGLILGWAGSWKDMSNLADLKFI